MKVFTRLNTKINRYRKVWSLLLVAVLAVVLLASCQAAIGATDPYDLTYLINSDPADVDNSGLAITPVDQLHRTGATQNVNIDEYRLTVDGLVETPLALTYEQIRQYPATTQVVLLICPGFFVDNAEWTGVTVAAILDGAGVKPEATEVTFRAIDGYSRTLSLEDARKDGVFLAYTVNGQTLPPEHGYPLRLVFTGEFGNAWVKWLSNIEVK
ncbi:MAG: molybdopterin-dependent oxidoreductase [Dehalococcoidales bacterium]|nr:molybdopterin-dependent oxidoreductase [Dehalococcoidales bacterium]